MIHDFPSFLTSWYYYKLKNLCEEKKKWSVTSGNFDNLGLLEQINWFQK